MYTVDFLTSERLSEFYQMITGLLKTVSPFIMIAVSIILVGLMIGLIIKTVKKGMGNNENGYKQNSDYVPGEGREKKY